MRTIHLIFATLVGLGLTHPADAQGLSAAECAQIETAYGVVPSECRAGTGLALASVRPAAPISEPTQVMRQNNIFFTQSGAVLDPTGLLQIQRLADFLNSPSMQKVCVRLVGHSDSSGGALVNMEMGAKRAAAVQTRLSVLLLTPGRIEAVQSMGEDQPLAGLPSTSSWQRRVTIWARDCPGY